MPDLHFQIESAEALEYGTSPGLLFKLRVENRASEAVRSMMLGTQIRIAANQREYSQDEQKNLVELFGAPAQWSTTLQSLLWTHATTLVPAFEKSVVVELSVPCTYDFEIASAKYFYGVENGEVPLEFLFSGTVFYEGETGLQAAQIPWDKEAPFRLPVETWKRVMEHYFPDSAWLRVQRDCFDRLYNYKARHGLPTWESALGKLLDEAGGVRPGDARPDEARFG